MRRFSGLVSAVGLSLLPQLGIAQGVDTSTMLRDRGPGQPTSMFGTYIRPGELLIYPFFEYYHDDNLEYKPSELGFGLDQDFRGRYRATEGLLFFAYGLTDWLAIEMEASVINATLRTPAGDTSSAPDRIHASGVGDVEGQVRARWWRESTGRPEVFSYFEAVAPVQTRQLLIATTDWEFKFGTGVIRGFRWGTVTLRASAEYALDGGAIELGEMAAEYVKRLSPAWRVYFGVEGKQDEFEFITEAQWHFARGMYVKFNNAFGMTSKATDWAPEVGVMFSLPVH
jgi:hypothetical protein